MTRRSRRSFGGSARGIVVLALSVQLGGCEAELGGTRGEPGSGGGGGTGSDGSAAGGAGQAGAAGSGGQAGAAGSVGGAAGGSVGGGPGRTGTAGVGSSGIAGSSGGGTGDAGAAAGSGGGPGGAGGGAAGTSGGGGGTAVPLDPSLLSHCTGTSPIHCTIPVPTDYMNYTVTVELGSPTSASTSRAQAELYRIVIPPIALPAGSYSRKTFSANVRPEDHDNYSSPGRVLDVLIDGAAPALRGLEFVAAPTIPTIFVVGDSTVCDWDPALATIEDPLERGWAQALPVLHARHRGR